MWFAFYFYWTMLLWRTSKEINWLSVGSGTPRKAGKGDKRESNHYRDKDLKRENRLVRRASCCLIGKKSGELPMRKESLPPSSDLPNRI